MCDYCDSEHPTSCCAKLNLMRMAYGGEVLDRHRNAPNEVVCGFCGHKTEVKGITSFRCKCNRYYYLVDNSFDPPCWTLKMGRASE